MNLFGTKTILKTCLNAKQTLKFFLSKVLSKSSKRWGIYSPKRKLAVRLICQFDRPAVDRPVDRQRSKIRPLEQFGRPPRYREQGSLVRSTARPTAQIQIAKLSGPVDRPADRICVCQMFTRLCTSVDRNGRPALGSVDPTVDRPGLSATVWVRTWVKQLC